MDKNQIVIPGHIAKSVIKIVANNLWRSALHLDIKVPIQRWLCELRGEKYFCGGIGKQAEDTVMPIQRTLGEMSCDKEIIGE